jgi:hypothetical protein
LRRAARVDENQALIVSALRSAGASVWIIGLPVDLVVCVGGHTVLCEVKGLTGKREPKARAYTPLQQAFMADWRGGAVSTLTDVDSALALVRMLRGQE